MNKYEIVEAVEGMGFRLDLDRYEQPGMEWLRFVINHDDLKEDEDYEWYWRKSKTLAANFEIGARILFQAGQKLKIHQFNKIIDFL